MHARTVFPMIALAVLFMGSVRAAELAIVQPANEETIHNNRGELTVRLQGTGGEPGGSVRLVLDGSELPQTYRGNVIELQGIDRGAHTLQAVLLDANGDRIAASQPVTFYMWQASRLFPGRK